MADATLKIPVKKSDGTTVMMTMAEFQEFKNNKSKSTTVKKTVQKDDETKISNTSISAQRKKQIVQNKDESFVIDNDKKKRTVVQNGKKMLPNVRYKVTIDHGEQEKSSEKKVQPRIRNEKKQNNITFDNKDSIKEKSSVNTLDRKSRSSLRERKKITSITNKKKEDIVLSKEIKGKSSVSDLVKKSRPQLKERKKKYGIDFDDMAKDEKEIENPFDSVLEKKSSEGKIKKKEKKTFEQAAKEAGVSLDIPKKQDKIKPLIKKNTSEADENEKKILEARKKLAKIVLGSNEKKEDIPNDKDQQQKEDILAIITKKITFIIADDVKDTLYEMIKSYKSGIQSKESFLQKAVETKEKGGLALSKVEASALENVVATEYSLQIKSKKNNIVASSDPKLPIHKPELKRYSRPNMEDIKSPVIVSSSVEPSVILEKQNPSIVIHSPETKGPVQELGTMNIIDFKRLSDTPQNAVQIVEDKFESLKKESFLLFLKAREAWFHSPLYGQYLIIIKDALHSQQILSIVLGTNKTLTYDEFHAIAEVNNYLG